MPKMLHWCVLHRRESVVSGVNALCRDVIERAASSSAAFGSLCPWMLTTAFQSWKLVVMKPRASIPPPSPQVEGITSLTLSIFRLNGELLQWGDRLVQPLGLTSARWQMLGAIALAGVPLTAPQIGHAMGVSRQGAQKQLNLLLEQGLVELRPNPGHLRSPFYVLTPQGGGVYRRAQGLWLARAAEIAARIPATQIHSAVKTLESMLRQLQPTEPVLGSEL